MAPPYLNNITTIQYKFLARNNIFQIAQIVNLSMGIGYVYEGINPSIYQIYPAYSFFYLSLYIKVSTGGIFIWNNLV